MECTQDHLHSACILILVMSVPIFTVFESNHVYKATLDAAARKKLLCDVIVRQHRRGMTL